MISSKNRVFNMLKKGPKSKISLGSGLLNSRWNGGINYCNS